MNYTDAARTIRMMAMMFTLLGASDALAGEKESEDRLETMIITAKGERINVSGSEALQNLEKDQKMLPGLRRRGQTYEFWYPHTKKEAEDYPDSRKRRNRLGRN